MHPPPPLPPPPCVHSLVQIYSELTLKQKLHHGVLPDPGHTQRRVSGGHKESVSVIIIFFISTRLIFLRPKDVSMDRVG